MAARPPRTAFSPKRTVRLVVDDDMTLDTLGIVRSLPTFQEDIVGIVPQFGGKCYNITLKNVESATRLTTAGFDYEQRVIPMRLLGPKKLHVSVFVLVEFPNKELITILRSYGTLKSTSFRRLYYSEQGFQHIERGIRVAEFLALTRDLPRKIVTNGVEIHFMYTGQPVTCYRCNSTEHTVKNCPKQRQQRPVMPSDDTESEGGRNLCPSPTSRMRHGGYQ